MSEPTDEQINEAIARWMGYKVEPTQARGGWKLYCGDLAVSFWWNSERQPTLSDCLHQLPRYTEDLNAVAEAINKLDLHEGYLFQGILKIICEQDRLENPADKYTSILMINATARQRALALVRTLNLLPI